MTATPMPFPRSRTEVALMLVVVTAIELQIIAAPNTGTPDALACGIGALPGLLLPLRHRAPLGVLFGSLGLMIVFYATASADLSPVVPLAVPLYSAARAGHLRAAGACAGLAVLGTALYPVVKAGTPVAHALGTALPQAGLLAALVLLGETVRNRHTSARLIAREREREAAARMAGERERIARELHDVLAHTLAGAAVQASVAADTLEDDPHTCRTALTAVRTAYRDARAELAATIGLLRTGEDRDPAPAPGLGELTELLDTARGTGLLVRTEVTGIPRPLPAAVEVTGYRIVQESLTNVIRHAEAGSVRIALGYQRTALTVSVTDDGRGTAESAPEQGYGQLGMRERVTAIGGELRTGALPGGGYRVHAELPCAPR